jgi:DNA-binding transcriptional LysR family regulator
VDTKLLETFVALAEERHFGMAATRLHLTQPAVSRQIKKLESELGTDLFERLPAGIQLTPAGLRLLDKAREIIDAVDDFSSSADERNAALRGRLRIGYSGYHIINFLPRLLRRLYETHPNVSVSLSPGIHGGLAPKAVIDGSLDFAFSRKMHHGDRLGSHVYDSDEVLIAVPEDHRLASQTSVVIEDVMNEPFITYPFVREGMVRNIIGNMAQNAGGTFHVRYAVADTPMLLALVAEGLGVAQTFSSIATLPVPGVKLLKLDGVEPLDNTIIWNASKASEPLHSALLEIIRQMS